MVTFYKSEKINERMTAIRSMTGEIMYLIEGDDTAVLVDTCVGVGHLRSFVEKLTDKPVTVVLTHGHIDHAMGASEFERVYMNPADEEIYWSMSGLEGRKAYIRGNLSGILPDFGEEDYVLTQDFTYEPLRDKASFDLGGIHVTAHSLPGHTKGTMVLLIPELKFLITGDACNPATFLFDANSCTVETYRRNLTAAAAELAGSYDRVFSCHHDMELAADIMKNVIDVCDVIMKGKADDIPFHFMGNDAYIAIACDEKFQRADGIQGNVIYNKARVWDE